MVIPQTNLPVAGLCGQLVEYRSFKRRYSVRYVPHTNCVDNDSTFVSSVALSIGCRNSRSPLGLRPQARFGAQPPKAALSAEMSARFPTEIPPPGDSAKAIGLCGERRNNAMSELCPFRGGAKDMESVPTRW